MCGNGKKWKGRKDYRYWKEYDGHLNVHMIRNRRDGKIALMGRHRKEGMNCRNGKEWKRRERCRHGEG